MQSLKDLYFLDEMRTLFHELALDPAKGLSTRPLTSCSDTLEVARVPGGSFLTCNTCFWLQLTSELMEADIFELRHSTKKTSLGWCMRML